MKVTMRQLAWYIERDGWRFQGAREARGEMQYTYRGAAGAFGTFSIDVPARLMPELEAERDKAQRSMRAQAERRAAR